MIYFNSHLSSLFSEFLPTFTNKFQTLFQTASNQLTNQLNKAKNLKTVFLLSSLTLVTGCIYFFSKYYFKKPVSYMERSICCTLSQLQEKIKETDETILKEIWEKLYTSVTTLKFQSDGVAEEIPEAILFTITLQQKIIEFESIRKQISEHPYASILNIFSEHLKNLFAYKMADNSPNKIKLEKFFTFSNILLLNEQKDIALGKPRENHIKQFQKKFSTYKEEFLKNHEKALETKKPKVVSNNTKKCLII